MAQEQVTVANGWALYAHPVFIERLESLTEEVERLTKKEPMDFIHHPAFKLLQCVVRALNVVVPADPSHSGFRLGNTLGKKLRHWCRVKKTLPQRYRLFFQFRSTAPRTIIYAWLNDDYCLRKAGDKTDCYAVFNRLVASGTVPNSYGDLLASAKGV